MKIIFDNITKKYKDKTALKEINFEMASGQLIGLIGKNGAGKTTLLKLLATILKPTHGRIFLDHTDIIYQPSAMREVLGYLPQEIAIYPNLTAFEYLNYIASMKGIRKKEALHQIAELLLQFHLTEVQNKKLSTYSGGMKQRIGIICALLGNPQVIIVDEPTTGLDPKERITIRNALSNLSKDRIVILSTHIVSDIEAVASKLMILKQGELIFNDTPDKLITNANGHVWEYTVQTPQENLKGVSNMIQTKQGILIRQVSSKKPAEQAVLVESNLEDACFFVLEE